MSTLLVNGQPISGDASHNMSLFLSIINIVRAGDTRMVAFGGDHGTSVLMVNPATQATLLLDEEEAARDEYRDLQVDFAEIIRHYTERGSATDSGAAVLDGDQATP